MACSTKTTNYQNSNTFDYYTPQVIPIEELTWNYKCKRSFDDLENLEPTKRSLERNITSETSREGCDHTNRNPYKKARTIKKRNKVNRGFRPLKDKNRFLNHFQPETKNYFKQSSNLESVITQIKSKKKKIMNTNPQKGTFKIEQQGQEQCQGNCNTCLPKTELHLKHRSAKTDFILPKVKYLYLIRKIKNSTKF
ncbi:hypothetical protein M0813_15609 [Anaeramoeba flamelloides]|uniref:Uncharacterized protein n=1 Tax=Anaeramoeba flamelloides TaxID=1746091 RepID=A0AAV8A7B6_9EUKA|nr:hypothetical protein M0812_06364 [Anaeramoeba flamelloides]KAJ6250794.1 hypothetical protein M0813_15609 [Anaeramoeba flamelloides]